MKESSVLFICLGNICRSPSAQGVFQYLVDEQEFGDRLVIDSAATGEWHIGKPPDKRAQLAALERGIDISHLRARQVSAEDFDKFDYILAMDRQNLADLRRIEPDGYNGYLGLFLEFGEKAEIVDVPDPYYGGESGFQLVLDLIQEASAGLLDHIRKQHLS